jgi:hypothetical protein
MQSLYNQIKANKLLISILLFAAILRAGMIYGNVAPSLNVFDYEIQRLEHKYASDDKPLANLFGAELANVACSLVCKREGFASPFGGSTGPTGWAAPGMVMPYAASFMLFGCFTFYSMLFMFLLALILSLFILVLIYRLSIELFTSPAIGCMAALLFALSPEDIFIFKRMWEQDFNIIAFLFILLLYRFIKFLKSYSRKNLVLFSLVAGMAVLCNPVFIFPVTGCLAFVFFQCENRFIAWQSIAWSLAILVLMCAPYIVYQKQRLGVLTFIKSNGLYEVYQGNMCAPDGLLTTEMFERYHPFCNENEYRKYKSLGEIPYIKSKFSVFKQHFDIKRFITLAGKRFINFFFVYPLPTDRKYGREFFLRELAYPLMGVALLSYYAVRFKKRNSLDGLIYVYILSYALPYCLVGVMYRYSFPIVPITSVLFAYSMYSLGTSALSHNAEREIAT